MTLPVNSSKSNQIKNKKSTGAQLITFNQTHTQTHARRPKNCASIEHANRERQTGRQTQRVGNIGGGTHHSPSQNDNSGSCVDGFCTFSCGILCTDSLDFLNFI